MPDCISQLEKRGLKESVIEAAKQKPFLGICLGLQCFVKQVKKIASGLGIITRRSKTFPIK